MEFEDDGEYDLFLTKKKQKESRDKFRVGRTGDCLMCPFQCDRCHFGNIMKRDPTPAEEGGTLLVAIRRANLDAFWSREPGTVANNCGELKQVEGAAAALGIVNPLESYPRGPFPVRDEWGMTEAACFLTRSLAPGRNGPNVQYGTARKMRSFFSNLYRTTREGAGAPADVDDCPDAPTNSAWHQRFLEGAHRRMGDQTKQDRALTIKQLLKLVEVWEEEWEEAEEAGDRNRCLHIARIAFTVIVGYAGGLRGEEIVKADLGMTLEVKDKGLEEDVPFTTVALRAKVKGEKRERCHNLPLALRSASGIPIARWMDRLVETYEQMGIDDGPMLRVVNRDGQAPARIADMDESFHYYLRIVQQRWPGVLAREVNVEEEFSIERSLRRGSTSQARVQEIGQDVVEANNRWRKVDRAKGKTASLGMMEHYSDAALMAPLLTKYSAGL
jgi:hypothetical protein